MAEELIKYEDKVKRLLITNQQSSKTIFKVGPRTVKVTSSSIVINGKGVIQMDGIPKLYDSGSAINSTWDITIPIDSIVNMYHESFKAECAMHYHKKAVGIDAKIDEVLMSYAIFTHKPLDLFQIIQNSRPQ